MDGQTRLKTEEKFAWNYWYDASCVFCFPCRWETWETTHDGKYVWKVNRDCGSNRLQVRQYSCFLLAVMNMAAKRSVIPCTVCSHSYRNMHFTLPSRSSFPFPPHFSSISSLFIILHLFISFTTFLFVSFITSFTSPVPLASSSLPISEFLSSSTYWSPDNTQSITYADLKTFTSVAPLSSS